MSHHVQKSRLTGPLTLNSHLLSDFVTLLSDMGPPQTVYGANYHKLEKEEGYAKKDHYCRIFVGDISWFISGGHGG
jgi:hypothetical protein